MAGRWRIVGMSGWDRDTVDLVEPGFIEFTEDGTGEFAFIAVRGRLDYQVSGRGWASLVDDAIVEGHLFFHMGDDSSFQAEPFTPTD